MADQDAHFGRSDGWCLKGKGAARLEIHIVDHRPVFSDWVSVTREHEAVAHAKQTYQRFPLLTTTWRQRCDSQTSSPHLPRRYDVESYLAAMPRERDGLLSEKHYDDDAIMVPSDSESEDESEQTVDAREGDRAILKETEEHEKLLHKPSRLERARGAFGLGEGIQDGGSSKKTGRRRSHSARKRGMSTPDKMETGFDDSASVSSFDVHDPGWDTKPSKKSHCGRLTLIYLSIVGLFAILLFGAYTVSPKRHKLAPTEHRLTKYTNGTHIFRPTTILISLDGFRADFLNRGITPALNAFIASGVSPRYMLPSFPSVTFPNHFTLVTGLYPESHGVVGNQFWDPDFQEEFLVHQHEGFNAPQMVDGRATVGHG